MSLLFSRFGQTADKKKKHHNNPQDVKSWAFANKQTNYYQDMLTVTYCLRLFSDGAHSLQMFCWWTSDVMLKSPNLFWWRNKFIYILDGLRVRRFSAKFHFGWTIHLMYECHESGYHSPKLHITHGLHLPACTALTHSRPPLHQSHSCHHSLINPDCLTTPAPHSLTHIKAAHKHSLTAKSCFALATFLSVLPRICYLCVWPRTAWPWTSEPVPVTSTPAWYCLRLCSASDLPVFACWPLPVCFCPG